MRISSTQIFHFDLKIQNIQTNPQRRVSTKPMGADFCSFGYSSKLKDIPKLPCACCGITMMTSDEFAAIQDELFLPSAKLMQALPKNHSNPLILDEKAYSMLKKLAHKYPKTSFPKILSEQKISDIIPLADMGKLKKQVELTQEIAPSAKKVLLKIERYAEHFHPIEKEVFLKLRKLSHQNPQLTLNAILNKPEVYNQHLKQLENKQLAVLNKLENYEVNLSEKSKELLQEKIKQAKEIILLEENERGQKRKRSIHLFYQLKEEIPEKKEADKIIAMVSQFPTSSSDVDAFFVKYAQRSSSETANRLLRMSTATIEHVKPRRREGDRGNNSDSNYIIMCSKCNNTRKQTPYPEWLKTHPEMLENVQKQLDKIIHLINIGDTRVSSKYPEEIKESLLNESNGLINVDISKLMKTSDANGFEELIMKYNQKP